MTPTPDGIDRDRRGLTVGEALADIAGRLRRAGVDTARLDARMLLAEVLGAEPLAVVAHPEWPVDAAAGERLAALVARRERREPMSHILGRREFWSLDFVVSADTLTPRPDSETLVEALLAAIPDRRAPLRLLDFGTGTGCLLLALLSELPAARGVGVDISSAALAVARRNADRLGMAQRADFVSGDWGRGLAGLFDVILSNPPYIGEDDIAGLEAEVASFEPRSALAGGPDGLACYRRLVPDIMRLLAPDGVAAVEIGQGQAEAVAALFSESGASVVIRRDLAGVQRCLVIRHEETSGISKKGIGMPRSSD